MTRRRRDPTSYRWEEKDAKVAEALGVPIVYTFRPLEPVKVKVKVEPDEAKLGLIAQERARAAENSWRRLLAAAARRAIGPLLSDASTTEVVTVRSEWEE